MIITYYKLFNMDSSKMNFTNIIAFENILDIEFFVKYSVLQCDHCNMPFICNIRKKQIYYEIYKDIYKKMS